MDRSSSAMILAALSLAPASGFADRPGRGPVTILFVGNSFTHGEFAPVRNYNAPPVIDENKDLPPDNPRARRAPSDAPALGGIPGIFKKMTDQAGLNYEVHVELVSATRLEFHYKNALALIAQPKWNAVVLQDYSTGPLPDGRGGKMDNFVVNATLLEKAIHAANRSARVYLYETFPRADLVYPEAKPYFGATVETMAAELHQGYERAFKEDKHFAAVAWVGDAWLHAIRTGAALVNPYQQADRKPGELDLWGRDHYHPSVYGSYLAALTLFQTITGISPRTLGANEDAAKDLGISGRDAVRLQGVVEAAAAHPVRYPKGSGVFEPRPAGAGAGERPPPARIAPPAG